MKEPQERYYNTEKLNVIFALVSVALLLCLVSMFADDYSRDWKNYQREFRALEIEKTRVKFDAESNKLAAQPEYQELAKKLEDAKAQYAQQCSDLKDVKKDVASLTAKQAVLTQSYQFTKAGLDTAKYKYEEARHASSPGAENLQAEYGKLSATAAQLKLDLEGLNQNLAEKRSVIDGCGHQVKDLERQQRALTAQLNIIQTKLRKIDPNERSLTNQIADIIRDLPVIDFANPNYKIEQIVLKDIKDDLGFKQANRVDRCVTCHLGIANPDYKNAPQPFTAHPNLELYLGKDSAHPMEDFGCTTCHGGRGRGTDFVSAAHTPSSEAQAEEWEKKYHWHKIHHWENPMLQKQYVEAGCFKCHSGQTVIKGAEKLNLGLNLIEKAGCYSCHAIDKYKDWPKPGPDLTKIASKSSKEWTHRWILDPKSIRHNTWMPSFFGLSNNSDADSQARSGQEVHAIVHYLFANSGDFEQAQPPLWGDPAKGEEIVSSVGCFGCHQIEKEKSDKPATRQSLHREQGPNLIGLGSKTSKTWLYNWLKNPYRYHPETKMPDLRLTDEEAAHAAAFLAQDKTADLNKNPISGIDTQVLDTIVQEFLLKTSSVRQAKDQVAKMTTDDKLLWAGQKLIAQYGCYSCHNIKGFENYKPIGTELTEEGSKSADRLDFGFAKIPHTKEAWFTQKMKDPRAFDKDKIKSADEELRMPQYHFKDEEVEALTTALLGFVKEKPEPNKNKPRTPDNIAIEEGQKIVRQLNCQGCHMIEGEGGAIQSSVADWLVQYDNRSENEAKALITSFGPPNLAGEGAKVQAGWLFHFLHQPTPIRPWLKVRMPTYDINVAHLNAVLKYFNALDDQEFPFSDAKLPAPTPEELAAAEKLFSKDYFGCAQCHIVGDSLPAGSPDSWAPDFALAKTRLKPEWLLEWLKNPQKFLPGTKMPTYFDPSSFDQSGPEDILGGDENLQIKALRDYLYNISDHPQPKPAPAKAEPPKPAEAPADDNPPAAGSPAQESETETTAP
ncbi:MAG: c-type cytochrome [Candidatus Omnitrophota bacterium]|nr:c-type cytochrome [Candidatus Omnitrophota bacterium]MDZ4241816.1 c-type cytochrome [Candidatus Omnitrophota bacterium]